MQRHHQPSRYHGHRYHLEQDAILAEREFAPASQRAIWNLADNLRLIDEAERILARGYMTSADHYRVTAALQGRSPEMARAHAQFIFDRDYSAAVKAERLHAQLIQQVAA